MPAAARAGQRRAGSRSRVLGQDQLGQQRSRWPRSRGQPNVSSACGFQKRDAPRAVQGDDGVERVVEDRPDVGGARSAALGQAFPARSLPYANAALRGADKRPLPSMDPQ